MSISENIRKEIDKLKISKEEKELLIEFLNITDTGNIRYKKDYQALIEAFIKSKGGK